ncbi:MAG: hypothetical protein J6X18_17150 [Bacteroidales bacterium]|nr:hypothetical protein [Bacteroidales bacterium]
MISLSNIGANNNTYVDGNDGANVATYATRQVLNEGDTIDVANIVSNRTVAEQGSQFQLYKTEHHPYMVWDPYENGLVVDEINGYRVKAFSMPDYLTGWKTNPPTIMTSTLTPALISLADENGNINFYGIWATTRLVRVIVYIPENPTPAPSITYNVQLTSNGSYTGLHPLTDNYKSIRDAGTSEDNYLSYCNNNTTLPEYGVGDGCPYNSYVTYFGVKNGESLEMFIPTNVGTGRDAYIPYYDTSTTPYRYYCCIAESLVRKEQKPMSYFHHEELVYYTINRVDGWRLTLPSVTSDLTIFVPLMTRPNCYVSVTASPSNGGTVSGSGYYVSGYSCTVTATPNTGYTFSAWILNGNEITNNSTYTFTVTQPTNTMVAVFIVETTPV